MTVTEIINKIIELKPSYRTKRHKLYYVKKAKLINLLNKLEKEASNEAIQDRSGTK